MAILHKTATVSPTKAEIVAGWLDQQPWGLSGRVEVLGSYRFDDPAGEVGVEALLVGRAGEVLHVPWTYRGSPLDHSEARLVSTAFHTVLGQRWIYDALSDPVGIACYLRAIRAEQGQAELEVWEEGRFLGLRDLAVHVRVEPGTPRPVTDGDVTIVDGRLAVAHVLGASLDGEQRLVVSWPGEEAVAAASLG